MMTIELQVKVSNRTGTVVLSHAEAMALRDWLNREFVAPLQHPPKGANDAE